MSVDQRMRAGLQQAYQALDPDVGTALKEVETMATKQKTRRGITLAVAASAVVLAGLAWGPGLLDSLGGGTDTTVAESPEDPAAVLDAYEDARNARDFEAMRALYADDAIITGHPLRPTVADVDQIISIETARWSGGANDDERTRFVNIEVSGDTATFTHLFFDESGGCLSGSGDEITVQDGTITTYTWGTTDEPCDPDLIAQADTDQ
jgi:ketosteroid isomerase-like protein